jgi:putative nucleotidyltransferase with HDIG domain
MRTARYPQQGVASSGCRTAAGSRSESTTPGGIKKGDINSDQFPYCVETVAATEVACKTRSAGHTRTARSQPRLQSRIHQILVSFGQYGIWSILDLKAIGKSCVATMSGNRAVLLISDRPDRSRDLAHRLGGHYACQMIGLYEQPTTGAPVAAVITDVSFRHATDIERLRHLLSQPRALAAPIVALLRDNSHLERVQAVAVGATYLICADESVSDIWAALAPIIRSKIPSVVAVTSLTPAQNIEQARLQFGTIFNAAERGEGISRIHVDNAAASAMAAIAEGGIRQWLDVVWTYDEATYQHCLLVTGLAAEFAASLQFARNDQENVTRAALLHDLGKAKIPLAILNKSGALTGEEIAIMRTHAKIGYELLRGQGEYEPETLEVVLRHHELLDGSGYPDGLAGPQINDLVRLVTICDVYAALIESRSYKKAMEPASAFKILKEMEGKLEGALVRAFSQVAERSAAPLSQDCFEPA